MYMQGIGEVHPRPSGLLVVERSMTSDRALNQSDFQAHEAVGDWPRNTAHRAWSSLATGDVYGYIFGLRYGKGLPETESDRSRVEALGDLSLNSLVDVVAGAETRMAELLAAENRGKQRTNVRVGEVFSGHKFSQLSWEFVKDLSQTALRATTQQLEA